MIIVLEFIDAILGKNSIFLIIGESYGGYLARGVLKRKFNLVDGLLSICPNIDNKKENLSKNQVFKRAIYFEEFISKIDRERF